MYLFEGLPKLLGYIPQRYKIYRSAPSAQFAQFIPRIEKSVYNDVATQLKRINPDMVPFGSSALRIGDIKDFSDLASACQLQGVDFSQARNANEEQRIAAYTAFDNIAQRILDRTK